MIVYIDNVKVEVSKAKLEDRVIVTLLASGDIDKKVEVPIVEYPLSISRKRVEFSPIYRDTDDTIHINNHLTIDVGETIRITDNNQMNGKLSHRELIEEIAKRSVISSPYYNEILKKITGIDSEAHIVTYDHIIALHQNREKVPYIYEQNLDGTPLWEILDRVEIVYRAIVRKTYQAIFENLSQSKLTHAMRKLNSSLQENIINEVQARAITTKVEIPWKSRMTEHLTPDCNLVMSDTPQSGKAGLIVSQPYKEIDGKKFSYLQSLNPFIEHCPPNRQVVSRYMNQICKITDKRVRNDRVKLLVARMCYRGYTLEDCCVISQSTAELFTCKQIDLDRFTGVGPKMTVSAIFNMQDKQYNDLIHSDKNFVNRGVLGTFANGAEMISRRKGIITNIIITPAENENEFCVTVETTSILRLRRGDKLADYHGNKVTISKILPDDEMPRGIGGTRIQLIVPPWIGKRASASRLIEEQKSLGVKNNNYLLRDPVRKTIYEKVAIGKVDYIRLAQHAEKKLNFANKTYTNYIGIIPRGYGLYNFADAMYHIKSVGADHLLKEILDRTYETNSPELLNEYMKCFQFELIEGKIHSTGATPFFEHPDNDTILENVIEDDKIPEEGLEGTITDSRMLYGHGWIRIPRGIPLSFHAASSRCGARSYDYEWVFHQLTDNKWWRKRLDATPSQLLHNGRKQIFIRIPPGIRNWQPTPETTHLSDIQQQINQLLIQIRTYNRSLTNRTRRVKYRINQLVNKLMDVTASRIFTKNGLLRNAIHPRVKFSMNAVASGNPELAIDECEMPIKAIHASLQQEEWRKAYDFPEEAKDWSVGEINKHLKSRDFWVLVMRNPAHQARNVAGLKFRVSTSKTININPAIVKAFDGDFDGDTLIGYTPVTKEGQEDVKKLSIHKYQSFLITNKDLTGFSPTYKNTCDKEIMRTIRENDKSISRWYEHNTGMSESIEDLEPRYGKVKEEQFQLMYCAKYTPEELFYMQKDSAIEFSFMKSGTANAGNIGNLLRNILFERYGDIGIRIASLVYHVLAQAALDCKNSLSDRAQLQLAFDTFRSKNMTFNAFYTALTPYFDDRTIDLVWLGLTENGKWEGAITMVIASRMPIAHIVNSGNITDLYKAAKNTKDDHKEGSFVEYLLESIHPRKHFTIIKGDDDLRQEVISWTSSDTEE